jgi:hypothetical protein
VYVEAPSDIKQEGFIWKLRKALYGLRQAPKLWSEHLCAVLTGQGFVRSVHEPSLYIRGVGSEQVCLLVHVDDVVLSGPDKSCNELMSVLKSHFQMTCGNPLRETGDTCSMLGRVITRLSNGYSLSGDPELAFKSIKELGLEKAKPAPTPLSSSSKIKDGDRLLSPSEHKVYRIHVGRLMYLAQDRLDLMFASKHLARSVHQPTVADVSSLKRVFRYILGRPSLPYVFNNCRLPSELSVLSDSDWASCVLSRKSTSGSIITLDANIVTCYSRTQAVVALSSGEAELNAAVTATGESLFIQSLLKEMSVEVSVCVYLDSTAAIMHLSKLGKGRLKHIQIKSHYVQHLIANKLIKIKKVDGLLNISDLLTKAVTSSTLKRLMSSSWMNLDLSLSSFVERGDDADVSVVNWWFSPSLLDADVDLIDLVM